MTTWSEIVASVISCQVKVCAEGAEEVRIVPNACDQLRKHTSQNEQHAVLMLQGIKVLFIGRALVNPPPC